MRILVVDLNHGGIILADEYLKNGLGEVFVWDIYGKLSAREKEAMKKRGIKTLEEETILETLRSSDDWLVIAPVHCPLPFSADLTHHEAVGSLLEKKINIPVIEITGVKGKTTVIHQLKEIFRNLNPLVLSSLGVEILENGKFQILKQDISITPASIVEAWNLAQDYDKGIALFENSLGATGLAQIGVLTNIVEDYSIAGNQKKASEAKSQIFQSDLVLCEVESFKKYYKKYASKTNTVGLTDDCNLKASKIRYGLSETSFQVESRDFKTISGNKINKEFQVKTFAPSEYHILNSLLAIGAALAFEIPINRIITGINNFRGIKGRTSLRKEGRSLIIEEINPGINVSTIKKSVQMLEKSDKPIMIVGGKYGITCEEINELEAAKFLDTLPEKLKLVTTGELGENINKKLSTPCKHIPHVEDAVRWAVKKEYSPTLLIYRSMYSDLKRR